ncbi:hypothetical protein LZ198_07930 [Myxococcus sp. K15C18031901]|uniref:hypothetical protein n=1 Tax=Myxococcus dinghuensis TaxID=2906761 RepID=UPI0020A81CBF|nr:hypothetical protein [Myxococcus dinghuensis]MCP3098802.1 hypothetical protein [Myxococcus dinghuensis]
MTEEERSELTERARHIIRSWERDGYDNAREAWLDVDAVLEQRQYLDRELVMQLDDIQNEAARMVTRAHLG